MSRVAKAVISVGALALLLGLLPWSEIRAAAARLTLAVWSGVAAGFVAGHALGMLKWRLVLRACRADLSWHAVVRCYAAGLFFNLCLPGIIGGDVLRAALAGKASRRPEAAVLAGVADRLIDVGALWILMIGALALAGGSLPGWAGPVLWTGILVATAAAGLLVPLGFRRPLGWWPRRIRRSVGRTLVALRRLRRSARRASLAAGVATVMQGGFVLLNAWIGLALGIAVPLTTWFLVWPLAKVVAVLPISLGGLGVRDATQGALLASVGVPMALGVVASLVWQSVLVAGGLVAGAVWWVSRRRAPAARPEPEIGALRSSGRQYA